VPLLRRRSKPLLALLAFAALALVLSACAFYKAGSLKVSQPAGIGSVRVHFEICTEPEPQGEGQATICKPNEEPSPEAPDQTQHIVGIAVPRGSTAPATFTGTPLQGGPPIVFTRNDQAAQAITEVSAGSEEPWPPAGMEGFGYTSTVVTEEVGALREWSFDPGFGLPTAADGGSFGGPFPVALAFGLRGVGGEFGSPERPVDCATSPEDLTKESAICEGIEDAQTAVSDLKVGVAPQVSTFLGGKATLSFPFDFASTAAELPTFNLTTTSTLPNAKLKLSSPIFAPSPPDPTTHRSPAASASVTVTVPKNAKPGTYDIALTATTPQGGSVSQVAKLRVTKAKLGLGKVKLNKAKGTATLFVKVPAAGTLTVSGKGLAKAQRKAKKAKTLKVPVKPKGATKALLSEDGKAKVKAKVTFKPTGAAPVVRSKGILLKQN